MSTRSTGSARRILRALHGAAAAALCTACAPSAAPPERIVLVVVDTLRADPLSPYGGSVPTPNIEALARRGQVFSHAVSSFHQTSMTMASLFTGRTPSLETGRPADALDWTGRNWCGMRRFGSDAGDGACIPEGLPTLAAALRDAGYWTAGVATNAFLFRPSGYEVGFEGWAEVGDPPRPEEFQVAPRPQAQDAEQANRAAAGLLARRPSDRFFLYVHYMDVHDYELTGPSYAASVARVDRAVGELLGLLREHSLLDGSVVIVTSDHGERLGESHLVEGTTHHLGNPSFEELLRVPLIVAPPLPGVDSDAPLRSDDVHRLIRRIAGAPAGPAGDLEDGELFLSEAAWQTYRRGRWKSFRARSGEPLLLVDLDADPGERRDVASLHPEVAAEHARRIDDLTARLGAGDVPPSRLTPDEERRLRGLGYLE